MKLRKKFLLSLSVLPLLGTAIYFFVQNPNICTREYYGNDSRKSSFCKISDDYLKVNKGYDAGYIIKAYEYYIINNEYYNNYNCYNNYNNNNNGYNESHLLSRKLVLFQKSGYWYNLYNTLKDNLEKDKEYYNTLLSYFEYNEDYHFYSITGDTEESLFKSTFNDVSEKLKQQVDNDMPLYRWSDFTKDIIQFICIILSLFIITILSIQTAKNTKSIPIFFATLIFDCLMFCCCFSLFDSLANPLLAFIYIILGIILIGISVVVLLSIIKNHPINLFDNKNHSQNYNNLLGVIKIGTLICLSIVYLLGIFSPIIGLGSGISNGIIDVEIVIMNLVWFGFSIYISKKLIEYIIKLKTKKYISIILIILIIISIICRCITMQEIETYGIINIISQVFGFFNLIVYTFWFCYMSKKFLEFDPKTSKILEDIFK